MIVVDAVQGTDEWLQARLGHATASRFRDILATVKSGEAAVRRAYRADLVVELLTGLPTKYFVSSAMAQGTEREPIARSEYEARLGRFVTEVGFVKHPSLRIGASPDGLVDDGGIEIKCPERANHLAYLSLPKGQCPPEYRAQVQGNMWLTERSWWDFISFNPDFPESMRLLVRRVPRDEGFIASLAGEVAHFAFEVTRDLEIAQSLSDQDVLEGV